MKKILGVAAAFAAMAVLGATDASAVCANALTFGHTTPSCGGYCGVVTPDGGYPTGGSFWSLGTGTAVAGTGNDNGSWTLGTPSPTTSWCKQYTGGCYLSGTWAGNGGIDGCIDGLITGGGKENMVVQFSYEAGGQGYYAAASASRNNAGAEFEFTGSGQNIVLQAIPKPSITGTTRTAPNVQISVGSPNLGAFTTDGVLTAGQVIKQYRVYKQVVPRAAAAPASRNRLTGWVAAGAAVNLGSPFSYSETDCATDKDIYLAASVVYDSGYESDAVSANSTKVQCGPTLAEPNPRFKLIDKKPSKGLSPRQ